MKHLAKPLLLALTALLSIGTAQAQDKVLNLYSARHYPTDEALYSDFTKATGIKINRVDSDDAGIIARLKAEGSASPADVILLVDAARLWRGEAAPTTPALVEDVVTVTPGPAPYWLVAGRLIAGNTPRIVLSIRLDWTGAPYQLRWGDAFTLKYPTGALVLP